MQPFERAGWAIVVYGVLYLCAHGLATLLPWYPSDLDLAAALAGATALPLLLLLYRYLPDILGRPAADDHLRWYHRRRGWFAGWWWKWLFLLIACGSWTVHEITGAVFSWKVQNQISPGTDLGFPSRLSPQTIQVLSSGHFHWNLDQVAGLLNLVALWLFWREWRKPKSRPGYCNTCGYNLTGNTSGVCPECGSTICGDVRHPHKESLDCSHKEPSHDC